VTIVVGEDIERARATLSESSRSILSLDLGGFTERERRLATSIDTGSRDGARGSG
jgi:hypothetical protein